MKIIKIFYCYAREDKDLRDELEMHLSNMKHQNQIVTWCNREIHAGTEWEREIDMHLYTAHFILLLISRHFMASEYCYGIEMKKALGRHKIGTAHVIPIILRPVDWKNSPFSHLQVLPTDGRPVTSWQNRDKAFVDIVSNIRKAIEEIEISSKSKEEGLDERSVFNKLDQYEEALSAYEQAIHLNPRYTSAYNDKGSALTKLKRYQEALIAYEQAIHLDQLGNSREAQQTYAKAAQLGYSD